MYQKALTDAVAQIQAEIQAAMADPTGMTAQTLIDDIVNPLVAGLTAAGVPALPDVLTGVQTAVDPLLASLGLATLTSALPAPTGLPGLPGTSTGSNPLSFLTAIPGLSLIPGL